VKKEYEDDKYGVLDVKIHTVSGVVIDVEIQVRPMPDFKKRCIFHQAKMVTEQISAGQGYSVIHRVVTIVITDFILVPENNYYHNQFRYRSNRDGTEFTNLSEFNILELPKLPTDTDSTELWYWMRFIKSDDKEELEMLAQRSPQMSKAVGLLKELSADERTRMLFEEREKARRDQISREDGARREGRAEERADIARNAISIGVDIDMIIKLTGLSREEIEGLR